MTDGSNNPPGLNTAGLTRWLERTHPDLAAGPLEATVIAGGKSNLTYDITGATVPLILRRPPLGHVLASAHDMRREHRVIAALASTDVPVPVAVGVDDDTDADEVTGTVFFVMQKAPGRILNSTADNADFTPAALHALSLELAEHLADLHAVDPAAVGLADFGRPDGYLARQLTTWQRQLDASRSREIPDLDALARELTERMPAATRTGIVHGDYRLDNALVTGEGDSARVSAILDWEMATLGDPFVDLGMFGLYWEIGTLPGAAAVPSAVDPAAGYASFDEIVAAYVARSGADAGDLSWYRAFAAFKLAVICEGIHFRYQAGKTVGAGFAQLGELVAPLAAHGREAL